MTRPLLRALRLLAWQPAIVLAAGVALAFAAEGKYCAFELGIPHRRSRSIVRRRMSFAVGDSPNDEGYLVVDAVSRRCRDPLPEDMLHHGGEVASACAAAITPLLRVRMVVSTDQFRWHRTARSYSQITVVDARMFTHFGRAPGLRSANGYFLSDQIRAPSGRRTRRAVISVHVGQRSTIPGPLA
jgi:hypothetical protein